MKLADIHDQASLDQYWAENGGAPLTQAQQAQKPPMVTSGSLDDLGLKAMLSLSDADFLRGLKTRGQDYALIVRAVNERIEQIAARLEGAAR